MLIMHPLVSTGVLGALLALASSPIPGRAPRAPDRAAVVPAFMSVLVQGNCGKCGGDCVFPWHQVTQPVTGFGYVGLHQSCEFGLCSETHGTCVVTFESSSDAARYFYVIRSAPPAEIERVIKSLGPKVHLNVQRRSVQVEGCGGTVAVNIPLTVAQVAALSAGG